MAKISNKGPTVAVLGAAGYTGRFVIPDLLSRGMTPIAIGRSLEALKAAKFADGVILREANIDDPESLAKAFEGAEAVIHLAGPFLDTGEQVVNAAIKAGIHYVDVAAEQINTQTLFEKYDEPARKAGIAVVPAMAFFGGLPDLIATSLMEGWDSVDSVEVMIGFDRWHPTKGTRNTLNRKAVGDTVFKEGRLAPTSHAPVGKDLRFSHPVGDQPVLEGPFCETILMAQHLKTSEVRTFITKVALNDVMDPNAPLPKAADKKGRSAQNYVLDIIVTRGNEQRRAHAHGNDGYAITAPMVGKAVELLTSGKVRATGVKAPGDIFDAKEILEMLAVDHCTFGGVTPVVGATLTGRR